MTKITFPEGFWQEYMPGCFRKWHPEELEKEANWREEVIKQSSNSEEAKKSLYRFDPEAVIVYNKHPEKGASQMLVILDILKRHGKPVSIEDFFPIIEKSKKLQTSQPVDRIYKHYHKTMLANNYINYE
tara:strand:+ start:117 stop:503 length:387 start_codon:yes stop_codon:yes gene_type:complete